MNCLSAFSPCTIKGVRVGFVPHIDFLPSMTHILFPTTQVHIYAVLLLHIQHKKCGIWYPGGLQWYNVNVT